MRNRATIKNLSVCFIVLAAAACRGPATNDSAGNEANVVASNDAEPVAANAADANAADANQAAPAGNAAATAEQPYRASGTEPFWSLSLGAARMVYDSADGPDVNVATPEPQQTRAGPMYVTPQLSVRINQFQRCTEASGEEVHDTVTVTVGTQTVHGCGAGRPPR